jgi:hypothetical protein
LYPTVPPTRVDQSARPRVFRGSSSRAAASSSTPYTRPPTPQFVQDLMDRVDSLQRRCSQLERENGVLSTALRDYTRPGMALNPVPIDSSPSATPDRVGYPIDQESLATVEPPSQVGATLSSTPVPPPPEYTPHSPVGSPPSDPSPPSPDYTPSYSVAGLTYSELLALDTGRGSPDLSGYLSVPSDVTPSEHPLSSTHDSTAPESDAAATSLPPAASVSLPPPTAALDPDLLLTTPPSPLVRED